MTHKTVPKLLATAIGITVLAACDHEEPSQPSQVVSTVNESEITVSQLRATLFSRGEIEPTPEATRKTLDGLINEQLLVQAARDAGFDRDPSVMQAVEAARRQILANAYVERSVFPHEPVSADAQTEYFKANPALFSQRRIYQLTQFDCAADETPGELAEKLDEARTEAAVDAVLESFSLACSRRALTKSAEQLPLHQLDIFAEAAVGDVFVTDPQQSDVSLMLLTGIQNSPLPFVQAQPIIQQYLANVRNAEALDQFLKEARTTAIISEPQNLTLAAIDSGVDGTSMSQSDVEAVATHSESVIH